MYAVGMASQLIVLGLYIWLCFSIALLRGQLLMGRLFFLCISVECVLRDLLVSIWLNHWVEAICKLSRIIYYWNFLLNNKTNIHCTSSSWLSAMCLALCVCVWHIHVGAIWIVKFSRAQAAASASCFHCSTPHGSHLRKEPQSPKREKTKRNEWV
jgi:hypothetical protein